MAKLELVEDPGVTSLFDDSAPAPKLEPVDDPAVKSLFDEPVEPSNVPRGTLVEQNDSEVRSLFDVDWPLIESVGGPWPGKVQRIAA